MKLIWSNFAVLQCVLYLTRGIQAMTFGWLMNTNKNGGQEVT